MLAMSGQSTPAEGELTLLKRAKNQSLRSAVRYKCHLATPGKLQVAGPQPREGWRVNIALGGIGILRDQAIELGTAVTLRLKSESRGVVYELPAQVVHTTAQSSGGWVVGCALERKLTPEELEDVLE